MRGVRDGRVGPVGGSGGGATASVLAVVGGRGGVGASTVAALAARAAAADGSRVALVDLDDRGGGLDVLLGLESAAGARWPDLADVRGDVDPEDLEGVLPRWQGVEVLSGGRLAGGPPAPAWDAVRAALVGGCDRVVLDLPRAGPGEELAAADACLLVTGQDVLGVAGALAAAAAVEDAGVPARLVLRRRRHGRVAPLEAAALLGVPLAAVVPPDSGLARAVERGLGPVPTPWRGAGRAVRRALRAAAEAGGG